MFALQVGAEYKGRQKQGSMMLTVGVALHSTALIQSCVIRLAGVSSKQAIPKSANLKISSLECSFASRSPIKIFAGLISKWQIGRADVYQSRVSRREPIRGNATYSRTDLKLRHLRFLLLYREHVLVHSVHVPKVRKHVSWISAFECNWYARVSRVRESRKEIDLQSTRHAFARQCNMLHTCSSGI